MPCFVAHTVGRVRERESMLGAVAQRYRGPLMTVPLPNSQDLSRRTIELLTNAIYLRDEYTGGHSVRVMCYALMLARRLNLPQSDLDRLKIGALLHDIGKIGIRDTLL